MSEWFIQLQLITIILCLTNFLIKGNLSGKKIHSHPYFPYYCISSSEAAERLTFNFQVLTVDFFIFTTQITVFLLIIVSQDYKESRTWTCRHFYPFLKKKFKSNQSCYTTTKIFCIW